MNWYKKATKNIRLPQIAYRHIDAIADLIVDFYSKNNSPPKNPIKIYTVRFPNPFYNLVVFANIFLINEFFSLTIAPAARRSNGDITVRFNKHWLGRKNTGLLNVIKRFYYSVILHEINHASDPKIIFLDKKYKHLIYEDKPTEFDALSKQMTEYFKNLWRDKDARQPIKDFLMYGDISKIKDPTFTNILKSIPAYLKYWKNNNPKFFRMILQRIYNEVINESNT